MAKCMAWHGMLWYEARYLVLEEKRIDCCDASLARYVRMLCICCVHDEYRVVDGGDEEMGWDAMEMPERIGDGVSICIYLFFLS